VTVGIVGRQEWRSGTAFRAAQYASQQFPSAHGDVLGAVGLGLRARVGSRTFQLEFRGLNTVPVIGPPRSNGVTFGTRLPF